MHARSSYDVGCIWLQVSTAKTVVHYEGPRALWKGLTPAVARGLFYGGLRLGLYAPIKKVIQHGNENATLTLADKVGLFLAFSLLRCVAFGMPHCWIPVPSSADGTPVASAHLCVPSNLLPCTHCRSLRAQPAVQLQLHYQVPWSS